MSKKEKPYQEDFFSNLLSGTFGYLGTIILGPPGALLGALGAPLGKALIKEGALSYIVDGLFPKRILKSVLIKKFDSDFSQSFLQDNFRMQEAFSESISTLRTVGMIEASLKEKRILTNEIPHIKALALTEMEIYELARELKSLEEIKISCTSIHPATISVFKSLSNKLSLYNINLEISYNDINGHYQVLTSKKRDFDSAVFPNDAFFMIANTAQTNYRLLFPINKQTQYLFHRKTRKTGVTKQVHIYQDSSAHMHYLLGQGIPRNTKDKIMDTISDFYSIIQEMAGGDMIIVWEPLANILYKNSDFELVAGSKYYIWNSLFCHKSWNKPVMKKARLSFNTLFVNEWRNCQLNKKLAIKLLLDDEQYLRHFALGSGIDY